MNEGLFFFVETDSRIWYNIDGGGMKLIEDFLSRKPYFKQYLKTRNSSDHYFLISEYSAFTHIPVLVVYIFYGQLHGFNDIIKDRIISTCKFYGYDYEQVKRFMVQD